MFKGRGALPLFCAVLLFSSPSPGVAQKTDKPAAKASGKVAGILIDKKDDWITVKADGEEEPAKYLINSADKRLAAALKTVFNASRVQLAYRTDGESRKLTAIKRQVLRASGVFTGEVVKVYDDFWVEVKPKTGVADAFAPGANFKDKAFMEMLKGLKPGDVVTIQYYTDFERHRIVSLRKK